MKVMVIGAEPRSLTNFRGQMLAAMVEAGHEVCAVAGGADPKVEADLRALGVAYFPAPLARTGLNPLQDLKTLFALRRLMKAQRPDVVLTYTVKPVLYGSLAAWLAGVPTPAAMITGIGSAFEGKSEGMAFVSFIVRMLYRVALRRNKAVLFQNPDDQALFTKLSILTAKQKIVRINGSGVDLDHYAKAPLPEGPVTFLMVARLIREKGIGEYLEAARILKAAHPEARVQVLGAFDTNPTAISEADMARWQEEGIVEYLGSTSEVRPFLAKAHVFVLPSFYREGVPRSILEAMAMGRAILTTDSPGCRETVRGNTNGRLVAPRSGPALAEAMIELAARPGLIPAMGEASHRDACERFDVRKVNRVILETLGLV